MTPIEALAQESQNQHARYHALYGTSPVTGEGLRELAAYSRGVGAEATDTRSTVLALNFSDDVIAPFEQKTRSNPF